MQPEYQHHRLHLDWQRWARACSSAQSGLQAYGSMLLPPPTQDTHDASRDAFACCCPPNEAQMLAGMVATATGHSHARVHTSDHHKPRAVSADSLPLSCPLLLVRVQPLGLHQHYLTKQALKPNGRMPLAPILNAQTADQESCLACGNSRTVSESCWRKGCLA